MIGLGAPPWIAGHRGVAGERVENTLASFALAVSQAADLVELDVQVTADDELVVFHDFTLDRLAARRGTIERMDAAAVRAVRLRDGSAIPTLAEVFAALPPGFPVNVELKRRRAGRERFAAALARALAGAARPLLVSSFNWQLLASARALLPDLPLAPLASRDAGGVLRTAEALGAAAVHVHVRLATAALVARAAARGRPVLAYTVNDSALAARLFARGVAGVFSDFPGALRASLTSGGAWPPLHRPPVAPTDEVH